VNIGISNVFKTVALLLGCLLLGSCAGEAPGEMEDVRAAVDKSVRDFHTLYNAQQFDRIYYSASPGYRNAISRSRSFKKFSDLYAMYGPVTSTIQRKATREWVRTRWSVGGLYTTRFAKGGAWEYFVFWSDGRSEAVELLDYDRQE
jgi:hypothetical protein